MGLCKRRVGDRNLGILGARLGGLFSARWGEMEWGSQRRGCCGWDDAPGDSGGIVDGWTMLHVTVGVPIARGIWKKNELLGPEGIDRFVGQTVSSNGLILIRLFFCPIGRIKQEP